MKDFISELVIQAHVIAFGGVPDDTKLTILSEAWSKILGNCKKGPLEAAFIRALKQAPEKGILQPRAVLLAHDAILAEEAEAVKQASRTYPEQKVKPDTKNLTLETEEDYKNLARKIAKTLIKEKCGLWPGIAWNVALTLDKKPKNFNYCNGYIHFQMKPKRGEDWKASSFYALSNCPNAPFPTMALAGGSDEEAY